MTERSSLPFYLCDYEPRINTWRQAKLLFPWKEMFSGLLYFRFGGLVFTADVQMCENVPKKMATQRTTPGERTKMRGVLVVESSTTCCMSSTGGSTNRDPRLLTMNIVTQKETRSGLRDLTISIRCSSLQALSHSPAHKVIGQMMHSSLICSVYTESKVHLL